MESSLIIEVTGVPEIRDVDKASTSAGVRIVHHGGGVGGEVLRHARRMGVLLVNCSVSGLLYLEAVLRTTSPASTTNLSNVTTQNAAPRPTPIRQAQVSVSAKTFKHRNSA
ncbi:hypothetical protein [Pyrobaculum sp. 3827-6]|uniref:hypothetical protein n=1 Tax=Pyrobaculum sp. 3827-6 TaxID=2983604 RepID=UPI0021D96840|nr:hypothetical protein [Pyrobaculum sp. 3827-6]